MSLDGTTKCAVAECLMPKYGFSNLCREHAVPGVIVCLNNDRSAVVTLWYAEHGDEVGIILLNDWALGSLFGGRTEFERQLAKQGFMNVRNIATPQEAEAARRTRSNKKLASWGGPWLPEYPWERVN